MASLGDVAYLVPSLRHSLSESILRLRLDEIVRHLNAGNPAAARSALAGARLALDRLDCSGQRGSVVTAIGRSLLRVQALLEGRDETSAHTGGEAARRVESQRGLECES